MQIKLVKTQPPTAPSRGPSTLPRRSLTNLLLRAKPAPARRILDFDCESISAGFEDPQWVPMHLTAIAWSWLDEEEVHVRTLVDYAKTVPAFLGALFKGCGPMLAEFKTAYDKADIITGHNICRFDIGAINAELMRIGMVPLADKPKIDTMHLAASTKGFKKGQDVMAVVLGLKEEKKALNWAEWQQAYSEPGWPTIRERCGGDVVQHKQLLRALLAKGYVSASPEER